MMRMLTEENRKWWILAAMTASISMIFVDITVLPVVLPTLQRDMQISDLGLQWVINAYTLALAVFVLIGGKLGDILGLRKTFCIGVLSFAAASAMCGLSTAEWWMIFSRALQGIGASLLLPATQAILISNFPPHQRGKALGLFVSIGSIFLALGPLIGGSLTTYLSWHYVFWINLPIAGIGLMLTYYAVPYMRGTKHALDIRGFLILALGIASFVIALMQAQIWGWFSPITLGLLLIGVSSLVILFRRKHKPHASVIDFELIKKKSFIASASSIFANQFIIMVTVFWAIYFQNILGFSASKAGVYAFLANIPVLLAAPLGGYLVDKLGPRIPVMAGFSLILFSLSWLVAYQRQESIALLMPTLFTFGFGVCMIFTPCFVAMMNDVPAEKRGVISGITAALRQFSSSLGLAIFGTIYSTIYLGHLSVSLRANPDTQSLSSAQFEGLLSKSPEAVRIVHQLPAPEAHYVLQSAKAAFLDAFASMNLTAAIVAFISILIAWRLLKNKPIHRETR